MQTPFKNDPFALTAQAFKNLYPNTPYEAYMDGELIDRRGEKVYGLTTFPDDGSTPIIKVSGEPSIIVAIETFAHELAHVAIGPRDEHGPDWEAAFDAIFKEYIRIGDEMFSDGK